MERCGRAARSARSTSRFEEIIEWTSHEQPLRPGDVLGSGTVGQPSTLLGQFDAEYPTTSGGSAGSRVIEPPE